MELGIVIKWVVFLICLIVLIAMTASLFGALKAETYPTANKQLNGFILQLLNGPLRIIKKILGGGRWNTQGVLVIALAYWVILPTAAIMYQPEGMFPARTTSGLVIALQIWLWPNIFGDYISLRITLRIISRLSRHVKERFEAGRHVSLLLLWAGILKDAAVASLIAAAVVFTTNLAFLFQVHQELLAVFGKLGDIMTWDNTFHPYSSVVGGEQQSESIPGKFLIAVSSFVPTLIWLGALLLSTYLEFLSRFLKISVRRQKKVNFVSVFDGWLAALIGSVQFAGELGII